MAFESFPHPSFLPYALSPPFLPVLLPQPSQLDYDDDGEPLSPVPSADEHTQDLAPGSSKSAKSGRKKTNPNSQAARRDQNRIAQREFRLRKQQRIRDLEARVEILSEGQDEAYAQLRDVIRDLMDENTTLRGLLRDVAGFVGEGLGGSLKPRTGWDPVKFREFCERGETDTAYEGWIARKRARGGPSTSIAPPGSEHADDEDQGDSAASRKRRRSTRKDSELGRPPIGSTEMGSSDGRMSSGDSSLPRPHLDGLEIDWSSTGLSIPQSNPNARSRKDMLERPPSATSSGTTFPDSYPSTFPSNNAGAGSSYPSANSLDLGQSSQRHSPAGNPNAMSSFPNNISPQLSSTRTHVRPVGAHSDILPPLSSISTLGPAPLDVGAGLSIGVGVNIGGGGGQNPTSSLFQQGFGVPQLGPYGPGPGRPMSAGGPSQPGMYYSLHPGEGQAGMNAGQPGPNVVEDHSEADPQLREAGALIKYHIDNYRRNENYHLPPSLRPTLTQRTVQHSGVIDGLIFPSIRDRSILLSGRFDLPECFADLMRAVVIHGDDVLAHANWELSLSWMKRYHYLVDEAILSESVNPWRRKRGERELTLQDIQPAGSE